MNPPLGLGLGRLSTLSFDDCLALLDRAWELGLRLFDAAPSYGPAEAVLGAWLSDRRVRPVVSTKVGYGVPGVPDWTPEAVRLGIDRALHTLRVTRLDVVHLHSCPGEVAVSAPILEALAEARRGGLVDVVAYSGENEDLDRALACPVFDGVQLSVSVCDQGSRELRLPRLPGRLRLVLAKRPLAGAPWAGRPPSGPDEVEYQRRFAALGLGSPPSGWDDLALRFAAFSPGVSAALVGTASRQHLEAAVASVARGPLPADQVRGLEERWRAAAGGWRGVV